MCVLLDQGMYAVLQTELPKPQPTCAPDRWEASAGHLLRVDGKYQPQSENLSQRSQPVKFRFGDDDYRREGGPQLNCGYLLQRLPLRRGKSVDLLLEERFQSQSREQRRGRIPRSCA